MKNLLTLFALLMVLGTTSAQTSEETLEWLKTKITERPYSKTDESKNEFLHKIDFTLEGIKLSDSYPNKGESFLYRWENIKDIRKLEGYARIEIAGEEKSHSKKFVFSFQIVNGELKEKSIKALKHMATSQGAKLVSDDLF